MQSPTASAGTLRIWFRRASLTTVAAVIALGSADAQNTVPFPQRKKAPPPERFCILRAVNVDRNAFFVAQPTGRSGKTAAGAVINVTYIGAPGEPWPQEAIDAFEYAKTTWEQALTSSVPITVDANWVRFGCAGGTGITLGSAGPNFIHSEFAGAPADTVWYPDALADALSGENQMTDPGEADIVSNFNADCDDNGALIRWYYGTDGNTPSGQIDFVSVVLHELGHGLGFLGLGDVSASGQGSLLFNGFPLSYDLFTEDGSGTALLAPGYEEGSTALGAALKGQAGGLFFGGPFTEASYGSAPAPLYAPDPFDRGSSYSHVDQLPFENTVNSLMTPFLSTAEATHVLGPVTCAMMADTGWVLDSSRCSAALPVEYADFRAVVDGDRVRLDWATASELDNVGFDVQMRSPFEDFRTVGFVPSHSAGSGGSYTFQFQALLPGRYEFRLQHVGTDGRLESSPIVEAIVHAASAYILTEAYPNPFNPETRFSLAVRSSQDVRVDVFDALGRFVANLHDGPVGANTSAEFVFDGSGLPSGLYVYRAQGRDFVASGRVMLLK